MNNSLYKTLRNDRPVQDLFENFKDDRVPFLLESSMDVMGMGRYSFFGSEPFLTLSFKEGCSVIEREGKREVLKKHPLVILRELLQTYKLKETNKAPYPFLCGAVGFFSYDFGFFLEKIKRKNHPEGLVPDVMFGFYDSVVCLDHKNGEVMVFSSGFPERGYLRSKRAVLKLKEILEKLNGGRGDVHFCPFAEEKRRGQKCTSPNKSLSSNFSKKNYLNAIAKAKDYIAAGDIYQVNLSQMFKARLAIEDWSLYKRLTKNFPVSFSAFFKTRDFSIMSASPERFLDFNGRVISTRPMKGTRKRTPDPRLNQKLKQDLIRSKKEKAELLMIVDLERNDLGRVCDYGSIKVKHLRSIEAYSNVYQATAEIRGTLHKSKDCLDLIKACFPGGSVTGCPKIRAMEIIEELEPDTRSVYTGSLGYFSFHNTLQFNILIRSFLKKGNDIFFNVGGGIVTDSKPQAEYEETLIKGKALMDALRGAF